MDKIGTLVICGATASGKTRLAIDLAKQFNGEIVSADSMQIYKGMDIASAKPSKEEQSGIPHHMMDFLEPTKAFSVADYVEMARPIIADIHARGKLPIICGGTGLYLDTLLRGGNSAPVADTADIRARLTARAEREGAEALHAELASVDQESAETIHPNNVKRVIRALEIYYSCGIPKSVLDSESKRLEPRYDATVLGLCYSEREVLYRRIEKRVDLMMEQGLLRETEMLMREGVFARNGTAAQAIGYKELLGYLRGEQSLEKAVNDLKTATRRYAKRQITWFSAKDYVIALEAMDSNGVKRFEEIVNNAEKLFSL